MGGYEETVDEIRKFNRFYTVNMGLLDSRYLDTAYSAAEIRILFEIKIHGRCIQSDIAKALHIDKSYLSRIIKGFSKNGFIVKNQSDEDKRAAYIALTERGNMETERLVELTNNQIKAKISSLSSKECKELCNAMHVVTSILGKA